MITTPLFRVNTLEIWLIFDQNIWGHPLAVSGQLAIAIPDASHHLILMAVT
jgi:hypothetical protein